MLSNSDFAAMVARNSAPTKKSADDWSVRPVIIPLKQGDGVKRPALVVSKFATLDWLLGLGVSVVALRDDKHLDWAGASAACVSELNKRLAEAGEAPLVVGGMETQSTSDAPGMAELQAQLATMAKALAELTANKNS